MNSRTCRSYQLLEVMPRIKNGVGGSIAQAMALAKECRWRKKRPFRCSDTLARLVDFQRFLPIELSLYFLVKLFNRFLVRFEMEGFQADRSQQTLKGGSKRWFVVDDQNSRL
jgi:hypothetical protein